MGKMASRKIIILIWNDHTVMHLSKKVLTSAKSVTCNYRNDFPVHNSLFLNTGGWSIQFILFFFTVLVHS